jgi:hypothetical protein
MIQSILSDLKHLIIVILVAVFVVVAVFGLGVVIFCLPIMLFTLKNSVRYSLFAILYRLMKDKYCKSLNT